MDIQRNINQVVQLLPVYEPQYRGQFVRVRRKCGVFTSTEQCFDVYSTPLFSSYTPTFLKNRKYLIKSQLGSIPYYIKFPFLPKPSLIIATSGMPDPIIFAADPIIVDSGNDIIYDYDSSWSQEIVSPIQNIVIDKNMIIPINNIINIENVQYITHTSNDGNILIWQQNDPFSTLDILEYQKNLYL